MAGCVQRLTCINPTSFRLCRRCQWLSSVIQTRCVACRRRVKLPRGAPFEPSRVAGISRADEKPLNFLEYHLQASAAYFLLFTSAECIAASQTSNSFTFPSTLTENNPAPIRIPCSRALGGAIASLSLIGLPTLTTFCLTTTFTNITSRVSSLPK